MFLLNPCEVAPWGQECKTRKFVDNYGIGIANLIKNTGIYFPTIVSMVCLESAYGESSITTKGYNFGGVKYNPSKHNDFMIADTTEYVNGRLVHVQQKFAKFKSVEDGLKGQYVTMMLERYKPARYNATSPLEQVGMYVQRGYSSTPVEKYKNKCRGIINACISYKALGRIGNITL
jgi:flagellum-specific peptidoglycan hydrolase FlgJ